MENKRFNELMAKYKDGSLSREGYEEFLLKIKEPGTESAMDKALDFYWKEMDSRSRRGYSEMPQRRMIRYQKNYWYGAMAASVIILLGLFLFM